MLIILGGLPGTGKSTIAQALSRQLDAVYLRIDTIEQAIRNTWDEEAIKNNDMGPDGYLVAYALASDNLQLGHTVIADSVNPIELTRSDWRKVANDQNKPFIEVEIICSDSELHKHRIETREISVKGLTPPTWKEVVNRDYELWKTPHLIIDTAVHSVSEAVQYIQANISDFSNSH
ncbi:AAA family ATPase [Legionella sp. W05-934-2]|jgi:predicted kinase|uniref:AAA family ATPase n=1 Tax=Legionella sp. W05-934-2 TaxID=1198649 RepID=UPI0034621538